MQQNRNMQKYFKTEKASFLVQEMFNFHHVLFSFLCVSSFMDVLPKWWELYIEGSVCLSVSRSCSCGGRCRHMKAAQPKATGFF